MALTDLTDTVWKLNDALATYPETGSYSIKTYNVDIVTSEPITGYVYIPDQGYTQQSLNSFENIAIGYDTGNEYNVIRLNYGAYENFVLASGNDTRTLLDSWNSYFTGTFEITGGSDAKNSELIAWLESNCTNVTPPTPIVTIKYGNDTIAKMSDSGTKTLKTGGKYLSGDVSVIFNPEPTVWTKPDDWPDLDALELPTDHSENVIYLLYDRKCGVDDVHLRFSGRANISKGTVDGNEFIGNEVATSVTSYADTLSDEYTVYRLTGNFTNFFFDTHAATSSYTVTLQSVVWVRGAAPFITGLGGTGTNGAALGIHTQAFELYDMLALVGMTLPDAYAYIYKLYKFCIGVLSDGDFDGNMNSLTRTGNGAMWFHMQDSVLIIKNATFSSLMQGVFKFVKNIRFENVTITNLVNARWSGASYVESVEFAEGCDVSCTNMSNQFSSCYRLRKCDLRGIDFSTSTSSSNAFNDCWSLAELRLNDTWKQDLGLNDCPNMTVDGLLQVFSDLPTIEDTHTITLPYGLKNYLLTPEEIAVVTEKGWTVA